MYVYTEQKKSAETGQGGHFHYKMAIQNFYSATEIKRKLGKLEDVAVWAYFDLLQKL